MAFGKKNQKEVVKEDLRIWECTSEDCNAWMRDNFKSEETPKCPICKSDMSTTMKELEVVDNHSGGWNK